MCVSLQGPGAWTALAGGRLPVDTIPQARHGWASIVACTADWTFLHVSLFWSTLVFSNLHEEMF